MSLLGKLFRKKPTHTDAMFIGPTGDLQKELSELAIKIAKEHYSIDLDYSHDSITKVEEILSDIHNHYHRTGETEGLDGIAMEFGFYIAATIQKNTGTGVLKKDHPQIGENTFPFNWNENDIFTYGWCEKRIFDGPEDDITSKYRIMVLNEISKT